MSVNLAVAPATQPTTRPTTRPAAAPQTPAPSKAPYFDVFGQQVDNPEDSFTAANPLPTQSGALIVEDQFISNPMDPSVPHGNWVALAAAQGRFSGPIGQQLLTRSSDPKYAGPAANPLNDAQHQALADFDESITSGEVNLLNDSTRQLTGLKQAGVNHGAVNLSMGADQASMVQNKYGFASLAWDPKVSPENQASAKKMYLDGPATAFGIDESKLLSSDPKVAGPERAKFQQALIDRVNKDQDNKDIAAAKKAYDASVAGLEPNKESVVVAGCNAGDLLAKMKSENGGLELKTPTNFYDNPLSNSKTITVGATDRGNPKSPSEEVAPYSNPSKNISIYASGDIGDEKGTSFASPRVAAAVAELHKQHPDASNQEVERLLQTTLTHSLDNGGAKVSVLDDNKSLSLFAQLPS